MTENAPAICCEEGDIQLNDECKTLTMPHDTDLDPSVFDLVVLQPVQRPTIGETILNQAPLLGSLQVHGPPVC